MIVNILIDLVGFFLSLFLYKITEKDKDSCNIFRLLFFLFIFIFFIKIVLTILN